jgi:uncharacterized repeat protein (TIGR02543 family)
MKKGIIFKIGWLLTAALALLFAGCKNGSSSPPPSYYTISFNSEGGSSVPTETVKANAQATLPDNPTKDGSIFLYWCSDSDCFHSYSFAQAVKKDMTLYAKWGSTVLYWSISYDLGGGSWPAGISPANYVLKTPGSLVTPASPEKAGSETVGYTLEGWYTNSELSTKAVFPLAISSNTTLYAKWTQYTPTKFEGSWKEVKQDIYSTQTVVFSFKDRNYTYERTIVVNPGIGGGMAPLPEEPASSGTFTFDATSLTFPSTGYVGSGTITTAYTLSGNTLKIDTGYETFTLTKE